MRVALVAPFGVGRRGTTGARVLPIAQVLARQGVDVRVLIPPWDEPETAGERSADGDVGIVRPVLRARPLRPLALVRDLLHEVTTFDPQVVHAFKPIGYSGALAWWLTRPSRSGGRRLIVVDADDLEGRDGWAGRRGSQLGGWVRGVQERATLRRAHAVTAASSWLAGYAQSLGVPGQRVLRLPNGCTVPASAAALNFAGEKRLLWYTRLTEADPRRVAALVAPLLRADPDLRLVVVGDPIHAAAGAAGRRAFSEACLSHQVDWLGYDPATVASLATADTVAIYPLDDDRVNRARCPAKLPELMALGFPIVAEAVGEAAAYLKEAAEESLVAPGEAERMRRQLADLLADTERRRALGRLLHDAARSWRWDDTAAGLLSWYEALMEQS